MDEMFNWTQSLRIIKETMFKRLSSVTFKKHSEQPSEDELDPTSRLDSFVQNFISFLSGTRTVKNSVWNESLKNSNLHAKIENFANIFDLWNEWKI